MTNTNVNIQADNFDFNHIGWKYYKQIKKKAMEQEFSWSGLLVSLSIAFFVVVITAFTLNLTYKSLTAASFSKNKTIYQLEIFNGQSYLHIDHVKKAEGINRLILA